VEVYYGTLLKFTNNLQHKTTNSFLTIVFKSRLQPYLHVVTIGMKRQTLQQYKEATLVCEGVSKVKVISNLSVPQSSKTILITLDNYRKNMNVLYKLS
jgi:stress response protein SCP2